MSSDHSKTKANEDWIEQDLHKMSYKELKKIAIQRNINPKLRKAQIVNALLTTEDPVCDKREREHTDVVVVGRVTRSRATVLRSCNSTTIEGSLSPSIAEEKQINQKKRKIDSLSPSIAEEKEINQKKRKIYSLSPSIAEERQINQEERKKSMDENRENGEPKETPCSELKRSNTFTISDKDGEPKETQCSELKRSNTFTLPDRDGEPKETQCSEVKHNNTFTLPDEGSLLKKNSRGVRKAPNFKAIHKKLFDNMESLSDNKKRKLARAKSLMQSPVPKCAAVNSPSLKLIRNGPKTNQILKTRIPMKISTPAKVLSVASGIESKNYNVKSSSTNPFEFIRKRMDKNIAKSTICMKAPPVNLEKKRDKDRAYIQGVRMNKRFLLQMEMRQKNQ